MLSCSVEKVRPTRRMDRNKGGLNDSDDAMSKEALPVYRIFISSTAIDLTDHRKKASDALVRLGGLPVGMETFGALPSATSQGLLVYLNNECRTLNVEYRRI